MSKVLMRRTARKHNHANRFIMVNGFGQQKRASRQQVIEHVQDMLAVTERKAK